MNSIPAVLLAALRAYGCVFSVCFQSRKATSQRPVGRLGGEGLDGAMGMEGERPGPPHVPVCLPVPWSSSRVPFGYLGNRVRTLVIGHELSLTVGGALTHR